MKDVIVYIQPEEGIVCELCPSPAAVRSRMPDGMEPVRSVNTNPNGHKTTVVSYTRHLCMPCHEVRQ